ncbi:MAG: hypothetical protein A2W31_11075 [Planctomycetes bacterium RBG_16_64_10]|nr:MAG: hypothetical protein A2W31_11075 [Planctomycetes bacterium RBG_16_64_10]
MTTVLVVDDSATDRCLAGGILQKGSGLAVSYAVDGRAALESMAKQAPDIVVTDLQMPELNGLELVAAARRRFPKVPVVVMTAHGSEQIAVAALKRGAASYVPKTALAHDLLPTVFNVLAVAHAELSHERMMASLTASQLTFTLASDFRLIGPLVQLVRRTMAEMGLYDEVGRVQAGVALEEALLTALYHGNLELTAAQMAGVGYDLLDDHAANVIEARRSQYPYRNRKIYVEVQISRSEIRFVIRHQGPGFTTTPMPNPLDVLAREDAQNRGLVHMELFMDEVLFNDSGKEIVLFKRYDPDTAEGERRGETGFLS